MKNTLLLCFLFTNGFLLGQDSIPLVQENTIIYSPFAQTETKMVFLPEIGNFNHFQAGLSMGLGSFTYGEGGIFSLGGFLGSDYLFKEKTWAPKVGIWASSFAYLIGIQGRAQGIFLKEGTETKSIIKLDAGLNFVYVFASYSFAILPDNLINPIPKHGFSLYFILPYQFKKSQHSQ